MDSGACLLHFGAVLLAVHIRNEVFGDFGAIWHPLQMVCGHELLAVLGQEHEDPNSLVHQMTMQRGIFGTFFIAFGWRCRGDLGLRGLLCIGWPWIVNLGAPGISI